MKKKNKTLNQVLAWGKLFQVSLRQDLVIFTMVIILLLFGSAMILSASVGMTDGTMQIVIKTFIKQVIFIVAALVLYNLCSNLFSIASLGKKPIYKGALIVMGLVLLITGVMAPEINGARAWIDLKFMTLQPSEFAKIFVIVGIASSVYAYQKRLKKASNRSSVSLLDYVKVPLVAYAAYIVIIAAIQNDLGSAIIILVMGSILFLIPKDQSLSKWQKWLKRGYLAGFGFLA
ncbi:MAG: FtsW/RodA/SpoVE family cell cycle protein, partial [Erysipelotrichaceae bacterium]